MKAQRKWMLISASVVAALMVALLAVGAVAKPWDRAIMFIVSLCVAIVVVMVPASLRSRWRLGVGAFVTAAGVVSLFLASSEGPEAEGSTNVQYLADLVSRGPFTEPLPDPLVEKGLSPARVSDPSAAAKLVAVQLEIKSRSPEETPGLAVYSHIEVYRSEEGSAERASRQMDSLGERYDLAFTDDSDAESFCGYDASFWVCGGSRGFIYGEVTLSPSPNANLQFATGILGALLRYGDRMTHLASD